IEAKAALKEAGRGTGNAAEEARKLLIAGDQDPDLLKAKVEKLIGFLRVGSSGTVSDLLWIGQPAAPYLVAAVEKEKADLEFIARSSEVLSRMGGKAAEDWAKNAVAYPDVLKRRAVIKGLITLRSRSALKVSSETVQKFLDDKEASVRRDAVTNVCTLVPARRVIAMLKDPDPEVQNATKSAILRWWASFDQGDRADENLAELIRIYDEAGWQIEGVPPRFHDTPKGRLLFLRALRREVVRNLSVRCPASRGQRAAPTTAELREVIITADALGMVSSARTKLGGWRAQANLGRFVQRMFKEEAWDHEAMATVVKLASRNYGTGLGIKFEPWFIKHAEASDIPAIAKTLRWLRQPMDVLNWMARQAVPGAALGDLQAFAKWLDGLDWKNDKSIRISESQAIWIRNATCLVIAAMRTADAEKYLVSLIRREVGTDRSAQQEEARLEWETAAFHALSRKGDDQTMRTLAELLVIPGDSKHARNVRYGAFQTLANLQADIAVNRFAKAYQLGFESSQKRIGMIVDDQQLRAHGGLRMILESRGAAPDVRMGKKPYSDKTLARIFDSCLATGNLAAFQDATYCVSYMPLPDEVVKVVANRALQCPDKKPDTREGLTLRQLLVMRLLDKYADAPGIVELIQRSLRDRDPQIRWMTARKSGADHIKDKLILELLEKCLRDEKEHVVEAASGTLFYIHPESLVSAQHVLLTSKRASVQSVVALALLQAKGADAISTVGKLLLPGTHLRYHHRLTLLNKMAEFRDMRAVPFLLEALKDGNDMVRKAAESELKSIRFYNDQKLLWKRLMDGTEMNATSAAEALVKQASDASKKQIRLTAIASLGTLGKVETLPFLIKLMSDEDPDIRKAAKAAADRINQAKARADK
ncbi:MAG: HEAT repeat domain-containing protein, partial [Planctomycetota bacterium]